MQPGALISLQRQQPEWLQQAWPHRQPGQRPEWLQPVWRQQPERLQQAWPHRQPGQQPERLQLVWRQQPVLVPEQQQVRALVREAGFLSGRRQRG